MLMIIIKNRTIFFLMQQRSLCLLQVKYLKLLSNKIRLAMVILRFMERATTTHSAGIISFIIVLVCLQLERNACIQWKYTFCGYFFSSVFSLVYLLFFLFLRIFLGSQIFLSNFVRFIVFFLCLLPCAEWNESMTLNTYRFEQHNL